jgi:DNA primase
MATSPNASLEVSGHAVKVTNPDKVFFTARGETKLDLARYFVAVGDGALRGVRERPTVLKRYPNGATEEPFFQKRVPPQRPDYNQNARDRTVASAYSVRANPEGRVSCPLTWDEIMDADPGDLTIATVPARFASVGDPSAPIDDVAFSLQPLLDLAARDEREGLGDEAWPPNFPRAVGEPTRVAPSRVKKQPTKQPAKKSTKKQDS